MDEAARVAGLRVMAPDLTGMAQGLRRIVFV
jgi:hypothetical protein